MADMIHILCAFCFFSVSGWILEVCYRSYNAGRFINPGLLKGPYLILYGTGALLLVGAGWLLADSGIVVRAAVYLALMSGLELASGFLLRRLFRVRLWDYTDQRFNYKGSICPTFSAYWVAAAFAFELFLYPAYTRVLTAISADTVMILTTVVAWVMLADFTAVSVRRLVTISPGEREILRRRYEQIARPLLEDPDVARLSRYPHHLNKTRLEHADEVAYLSFLWASRLSLDVVAVVRGALLHDLFYYDWLTEGPRLHGLRHPRIALENARRVTDLSKKEEDIILKHMWPITVIPPRYPESLVVSSADTVCAVRDYLSLGDYDLPGKAGMVRLGLVPQRIRGYTDIVRRRIGSALRRR